MNDQLAFYLGIALTLLTAALLMGHVTRYCRRRIRAIDEAILVEKVRRMRAWDPAAWGGEAFAPREPETPRGFLS